MPTAVFHSFVSWHSPQFSIDFRDGQMDCYINNQQYCLISFLQMPITSLQAVCGFSWVTVDLQSVVIWYNHSERSRRQWNQECFELKIALNSASRTLHAQFTCALESKKYVGSALPWYGSSLWSSKSASLVLSLSDPTSFSTWCPLIGSSADEGFHLTLYFWMLVLQCWAKGHPQTLGTFQTQYTVHIQLHPAIFPWFRLSARSDA